MKKKQIQLKEMEIHALGAMNEHNGQQLKALLDSYRKMLFPGAEKDEQQNSELEKAKAALAAEANKVLIVRKLKPGEGMPGRMHPKLQDLAARQAADIERERMKEHRRLRSRRRT